MVDTNEAQLLSDLLCDIAREDARLEAGHLEARVIDAADAGAAVRLKPDTARVYWPMAAAVIFAILVPAMFWRMAQPSDTEVGLKMETTEEVDTTEKPDTTGPAYITEEVIAGPGKLMAAQPSLQPRRKRSTNAVNPTNPTTLTTLTTPTPPSTPSSVDEFIPLMPMTDQELSGPLQIVRVQLPRASLGALRSPLEVPNELVEADVLLGQDGMARAIRVSTSGSVYPWRAR